MRAPLVSSVSAPLAKKGRKPGDHPVSGRTAQSVRVEETVCVADASATPQRVEVLTMVTSASATMNTVKSSRINYVEVEFQSFSVLKQNNWLIHYGLTDTSISQHITLPNIWVKCNFYLIKHLVSIFFIFLYCILYFGTCFVYIHVC